MSIAEIERFAADLKSNEALCAEAWNGHADKTHATPVDRVVSFAASKGYAFTVDEVKEYAKTTAKAAGRELTDAELTGVAGGSTRYSLVVTNNSTQFQDLCVYQKQVDLGVPNATDGRRD